MLILAVDIGTGTQDILLFDTTREAENCLKMVMPSPTVRLAEAVRSATRRGQDIVLTGVTMGGGPCTWAVRDHLKSGYRAYATPAAARTFDDDLAAVEAMGVVVVSEDEASAATLHAHKMHMHDFDYRAIVQAFAQFGVDLDRDLDALAVAVFDHGNAPVGTSDRLFRFAYLAERLRSENRLSAFGYCAEDVPESMTRMRAVVTAIPRDDIPVMIMDTAPAAVLGAMEDPLVRDRRPLIVVNVGNFHCLAFRFGKGEVEGVFEHHTGELTRAQLEDLLDRLADGTLSNDDIYGTHGHGAIIFHRTSLPPSARAVAVTGPRRNLLRQSRHEVLYATPFGDMMLTGCYGLIRAYADLAPEHSHVIAHALDGGDGRSLW